ncbi:MAG: zf-HC2 domain-containing protein [Candidatus Zixiibacteriota bacterium]|nr:MAG: zf-HC2 domain-containing protein [candidate division Zixibacteria bacterium]
MTCEEALRRLYDVIDKEADEIDVKEVQEHLAHCENCMARYEFEAMFKTFIRDKALSTPKSDQLKNRILTRIEDAERSRGRFFKRPFRYQAVIVAAAAALVLCIVAAFSVAGYYRQRAFIQPFEDSHMAGLQTYQTQSTPVRAGNPCAPEVLTFIEGYLPAGVQDSIPGYAMIGSCLDVIQDVKFAHLSYVAGESMVSLFVGSPDGVNLPDFERVEVGGQECYRYVCKNCQLMYWMIGNTLIVAVSEDKSLPLPEIMPAVSAI